MLTWLRALAPFAVKLLPQVVQWRLMVASLLLVVMFQSARREPQQTGTLCGAGILLVLLLQNWWLVSSRG
ncbi:hypothetical protein [Streptomyces sp. NPDC029004]|uniref:hypothetical protein n=1 Tax=Streptomyces sp. NPDC029004 TaxID=3154490 RepID=UPI0033F61281